MNRRQFLTTSATTSAALIPSVRAAAPAPAKSAVRLAVSSYSYWHFKPQRVSIETVMDKAAALDVPGVDVLHRQMELDEKGPLNASAHAYCMKLKRHALQAGVSMVCLSIHQNFVSPDPARLKAQIAHTEKCIELAYALGIPVIRLNSGSWGTVKDFNELMKRRGEEPPIEGHTEDEAFKWCIDSLNQVLVLAEQRGITLAVENHWGLSRTVEGHKRILDAIKSPWLGAMMDTGNFLEDPYEKLRVIAPRTVFVQAKTYDGGGEWFTLDLDYARIAGILKEAGYRGWVSLEMEGKEHADTAVPAAIARLRAAFSA